MSFFKSSVEVALLTDRELFGKPHGGRLALVCPHPKDKDILGIGERWARDPDQPMFGLDGGEGWSAAMDVGAAVWWVVEPLEYDRYPNLCWANGEIELRHINIEFAGTPSEAVDYLVRTPMHASAAVFGATIHATNRGAIAVVGDLGVAISTAGSASAGRGGVAICNMGDTHATVGDDGVAIGANWNGTAISGERGQSYTGRYGFARAGRHGLAVAGDDGRASGTHVVIGKRSEAEVRPGAKPMFAAGEGSRVHIDGLTYRAGEDFEPRVAHGVEFGYKCPTTFTRRPELDAFVQARALDASCCMTNPALVKYFLDFRPLQSAAAREHGIFWTASWLNPHGVLELPQETQQYFIEARRI